LRRILALAVLVYLTADYSDPLLPGVFWFDTESFFVESTEARPVMPVLVSPAIQAMRPAREVLEPITTRVIATAPTAPAAHFSPRAYTTVSPPSAPESSDDH
jgi:hypothetical protein